MTQSELNSPQRRANERLSAFVPRYAWESTVAVVIASRPALHLLGSGSLFQIAEQHFVVTAAHVVKPAHEHDKTIGITGDQGCMISVHGEWMVSASNSEDDPFDIAVYRLPERALANLSRCRFLKIADADFCEQPKSAVYTVFGHPGIWASPSRRDEEALQLKGLEYSAYTYERSIETLEGYEPKYHLLLDAEAERVSWSDGSKATFRKLDGSNAVFPRELKGISGGPVWRIGDLSIPIAKTPRRSPLQTRLVFEALPTAGSQ